MLTPETNERLLAALNAARPVTSRKMFGGVGIYHDGAFFAVIDDDRLFFKSDAETESVYDVEKAEQWIIPQGPMPYREIGDAVLNDPVELGKRIDAAVGVFRRKQASKKPRRAKS
ncbi:hypothetical protein BH11ARM2_BH11ARM2_23570 [soil metagenome]